MLIIINSNHSVIIITLYIAAVRVLLQEKTYNQLFVLSLLLLLLLLFSLLIINTCMHIYIYIDVCMYIYIYIYVYIYIYIYIMNTYVRGGRQGAAPGGLHGRRHVRGVVVAAWHAIRLYNITAHYDSLVLFR